MYKKKSTSWQKHLDFIVIDIFAMYAAYLFVYLLRGAAVSAFFSELNTLVLITYFACNLFCVGVHQSYKNVLKRGYAKEFAATALHVLMITGYVIVILYALKRGTDQSRLQIFCTAIAYVLLSYLLRLDRKRYIRNHKLINPASILLVVNRKMAEETIKAIDNSVYHIAGIAVIDANMQGEEIDGIAVVANRDNVVDYALHEWVDEVLFNLDQEYQKPDSDILNQFLEMGITTHTKLYKSTNVYEWNRTVEHVGEYMVLTRAVKMSTSREQTIKRIVDVCGALVGLVFCGIIYIFVAPAIYIASPGPVIYASTRIGKNGKKFKFYKFRSMYLDADKRKAELMSQNRVSDGMMFKLDWDPRIIGNKELPDGTRKTGIGNFIRKTSLDEFPQFWNVLKGDMSIVGTRPPTEDEWNKYNLHHRSRMAVKPGITGMWQVSGRSEITDFDEVVRLDREYISKWSIGLDIKIILMTVVAVLKREGSM